MILEHGGLRSLCLNGTHVDGISVSNFVVVKHAVFEGRAKHPNTNFRLNENAAAIVDVELVVIGHIHYNNISDM